MDERNKFGDRSNRAFIGVSNYLVNVKRRNELN